MKRTTPILVAALIVLSACATPQPITGRADNNMLRFSASNYTMVQEGAQ